MIAFFLGTSLGRSLIGVVAVLVLLAGVYVKGRSDGKALIQARWDAAEAAMLDRSIEARDEAEQSIPPVVIPDAGAPAPQPCRVRDPYDRDCS